MDCRWLTIAWKAVCWISEKGWYRHNTFHGFHVYSRFPFWNCLFLTNRLIWGWKRLITWLLRPFTNKHRAFFWIPCCSEVQAHYCQCPFRSASQFWHRLCCLLVPSTLFSSSASIFAIFLPVFRKAVIRAAWSSLPFVSKWKKFPLLFRKGNFAKQGNSLSFTQPPLSWAGQAATRHSRSTTPQAKTFPSEQTSRAWGFIWGFPANISKDAKWNSSSKAVISLLRCETISPSSRGNFLCLVFLNDTN